MASAQREDWGTPQDLFLELQAEFHFTIDAAASAENALLPRFWTAADDAIQQDWKGERVFCNPPYGARQADFIAKAAERRAEVAVLLLPARPDHWAWHRFVWPLAEVRFRRGRIRFEGATAGAPFPSALVIYRALTLRGVMPHRGPRRRHGERWIEA